MQNLLEVARTAENFALNTRGALSLRRFSSPDLASLKCHAFLRPTPKRTAAPWGAGGKGRITFQTTTYRFPSTTLNFIFLRIQLRNS